MQTNHPHSAPNQSCNEPIQLDSNSTNPIESSDLLHENGGKEVRIEREVWSKLAESEARLHLIMELQKLKVGFPDVEEFCLQIESKYRSVAVGSLQEQGEKSPEWQIVKICMDLKLKDERKKNAELVTERYNLRRKIEETLGRNTRRTRNKIKNLRTEAARRKKTVMTKYEDKLTHLRKKYRIGEEEKIDNIPESIKDLKLNNLSIFNKKKFEEIKTIEYETEVLGDLELSVKERMILRLPPKFAIEENLPPGGLSLDEELGFAKARMTLKKEQDEKLEREEDEGIEVEEEVDEELEEEMEKVEARSRQIYDPKTRTYDDQRRRVTDLKECSRVTLPKPLDINNEALIEMRRSTNDKIYEEHREKECNKKGEVEGNLSEDEKEGLRSLQKRMKNKEIVILKTDKSGKLVVTNREEYIKMGLEHTKKDEEVTSKEVREMEKQVNGHVFFWVKMWGSGDSHGQRDRIIDSKVVSSEQLASMYLTYKDHKQGRKTRPVVTGCNSNTRGFSNCVSDLLESVNKANEDSYEAINSEDVLAEVERFNIESEKIRKEGREKLLEKLMCRKSDGLRRLACCDHLWTKKSKSAREAGKTQQEHEEEEIGNQENEEEAGMETHEEDNEEQHRKENDPRKWGCLGQKNEEILRYRQHQYRENPTMKLTPEDAEEARDCDICGPDITECVLEKCEDCGDSWVEEDYTMCIIGNDVVSLFPNLDSKKTGEIVREEVSRSTMNVEGFNFKLGTRYIYMNKEYTGNLEKIEGLLPYRLTKPGTKPTMKCKWVNSKEIQEDKDWVYPARQPTMKERRLVMGHVAEIGTRVIFENFCYQFGNKMYHQQAGGPIGARVTMCAARMVMQHWARDYANILLKAGLRVPLLKGYIDDGRQGSTLLRKGMLYDQEKGEFTWTEEQYKVDMETKEPANVRMARVCLPAMNAVNGCLKFTTEAPEEFKQNRLPTLDFVLWLTNGILYHSYFEKEMKSQFTIMRRSAMSEQQKASILSNELVRRLSNIHRDVLEEELEPVIEHFIQQLKNSGYERKQAKEVVVCGVVGWRRKLERREKAGHNQFRTAKETLEERTSNQLLEKTNWFKEKSNKRKIEEKESKYQYTPANKKRKTGGRVSKTKANGSKNKIKAVMFVP